MAGSMMATISDAMVGNREEKVPSGSVAQAR